MATEQIFIWVCFQIKNIKWGEHIYIHIATFTFTYMCLHLHLHICVLNLSRFKTHLDDFLCHLLWVTFPWTGQSPEVPFNPKDSVILCTCILQVHKYFKEQILTKTLLNIIFLMHSSSTESTISCIDTTGFELLKFHPNRNSNFLLYHRVWIIFC